MFTNWTGNATTSTVDVFLYDRFFANALYVLISLCCLALITALTTGYMILNVCCCSSEMEEEPCRGNLEALIISQILFSSLVRSLKTMFHLGTSMILESFNPKWTRTFPDPSKNLVLKL